MEAVFISTLWGIIASVSINGIILLVTKHSKLTQGIILLGIITIFSLINIYLLLLTGN